jgi:sec-independent protein translocase protein TatA
MITGFVNLPGGSEWLLIFLVILIIFGPKSLPKIGHAIGRGMKEFRDASDGLTRAIEEEVEAEDRRKALNHSETTSDETTGDDTPEQYGEYGETPEPDDEHAD